MKNVPLPRPLAQLALIRHQKLQPTDLLLQTIDHDPPLGLLVVELLLQRRHHVVLRVARQPRLLARHRRLRQETPQLLVALRLGHARHREPELVVGVVALVAAPLAGHLLLLERVDVSGGNGQVSAKPRTQLALVGQLALERREAVLHLDAEGELELLELFVIQNVLGPRVRQIPRRQLLPVLHIPIRKLRLTVGHHRRQTRVRNTLRQRRARELQHLGRQPRLPLRVLRHHLPSMDRLLVHQPRLTLLLLRHQLRPELLALEHAPRLARLQPPLPLACALVQHPGDALELRQRDLGRNGLLDHHGSPFVLRGRPALVLRCNMCVT